MAFVALASAAILFMVAAASRRHMGRHESLKLTRKTNLSQLASSARASMAFTAMARGGMSSLMGGSVGYLGQHPAHGRLTSAVQRTRDLCKEKAGNLYWEATK